MGIDTIKVIYTYSIATIIVVGGFIFLYFTRTDPPGGQSSTMVPLVAGFVGAAIQFVFNRETQTSTARQVERGIAAGSAASNANPGTAPLGTVP